MDIDFRLRQPLRQNVFDDNEKKTEAYIASIDGDLRDRLPAIARSFQDTVAGYRESEGQHFNPETDSGQAIANDLYQLAIAYLAYRMGDAMSIEVHQPSQTHDLAQDDAAGKKGYVMGWVDHLAHTFDTDVAAAMTRHVTNAVDTVLCEYFPKIQQEEPGLQEELANELQVVSGPRTTARRHMLERSLSRGKGSKPPQWEMN